MFCHPSRTCWIKITKSPLIQFTMFVERLFYIMDKKVMQSSYLCYSSLCHTACLQPVPSVAKLYLKHYFCLIFHSWKCAKWFSEGDADRELESELLSIFLLNFTCVFAVHRRQTAIRGNNSFSLISDLIHVSSGKISVGFCDSLFLSSPLNLFPCLLFSFPIFNREEFVGLEKKEYTDNYRVLH